MLPDASLVHKDPLPAQVWRYSKLWGGPQCHKCSRTLEVLTKSIHSRVNPYQGAKTLSYLVCHLSSLQCIM
ncbi:unnamed protein product [Linum tenue]|uniref:Uncharacterized protein n=1 Tax=Linum tenue TaxID=586396 RepID=A0AAV0KWM1_9ROSI|nr:unnamed protein product [Linum tenue]